MQKMPLLNTHVNNMDMSEAIKAIERMIIDGGKHYIAAVNVDVIVKIEDDDYLKEIFDKADLVLVDGKPLVWIAKWLKQPVKARIAGADFVPILCERATERGYSIFIIGGKAGIADQAKKRLVDKYPKIKIVGTYAPPFGFEDNKEELKRINDLISGAHPDLLVACFGCPKQEKWVYENYQKYDVKVSVCAGATVDFLAGNVSRAPKWMSEHGLEWFYRFLQEPKRLFRRYFIDDAKVLNLIWKYRRTE